MTNKKWISDIFKVIVGCATYAVGFRFFFWPNAIVTGGVTGISMILSMLSGYPVGVLTVILNIPIFLIAWKRLGIKLVYRALAGMLSLSFMVDLSALADIVITSDPLLAVAYGGLLMGFGLGLVYSTGYSTGGTDLAARLLQMLYPSHNYGTMLLILDGTIIASFALIFREYDRALIAIIGVFIISKLIDFVLYGAVNSKLCYIITNSVEDIGRAITGEMGRGATLLRARGAYTGEERGVIMCAISKQQIVELKNIVNRYDSNAFFIISEAHGVYGNGFQSIEPG